MIELPVHFQQTLQDKIPREYDQFIDALQEAPPTSIRLHPFKNNNSRLALSPTLWNQWGRYLDKRPSFTFDPAFHAGAYYVQEASSMSLWKALENIPIDGPLKVLDLCAAPGGKSTLIADFLHQNNEHAHLLFANEVISHRAGILAQNMVKWGYANQLVINMDPAKLTSKLGEYYDIIVADCPCSGEGMFRKDPNAIQEWSPDNVNLCDLRQKRILHSAVDLLKPGGHLIYSTCTYNDFENMNQVYYFEKEKNLQSLRIPSLNDFGITEIHDKDAYGYQFYPHKTKGEGFFICMMQKVDGQGESWKPKKSKEKQKKHSLPFSLPNGIISYENWNGDLVAVPETYSKEIQQLIPILRPKLTGTLLGKPIRNEIIPAHDLALSAYIKTNIEALELSTDQAISYLRKQDIEVSGPLGWRLITYEGNGLGWAKVLKNRVNNYYPKNWRILK